MSSSDGASTGPEKPEQSASIPRSGPRATYPTEQSPESRRRWFYILTGGMLLAGVVIAFLGFRSFGDPDISGTATGYDVHSNESITVRYTVDRKNPDQPVVCVVRARAQDGAEVGRREVYIPGGDDAQVGMNSEVRTSREPVIGEVFGCTGNVPAYLTPID